MNIKADPQYAVAPREHNADVAAALPFVRTRIRPSANLLKDLRQSLELSQEQMGIALGIGHGYLKRLESGTVKFPTSKSKVYRRVRAIATYAAGKGDLPYAVEEYITSPLTGDIAKDAELGENKHSGIDTIWDREAFEARAIIAEPPEPEPELDEVPVKYWGGKAPRGEGAQRSMSFKVSDDIANNFRRDAYNAKRMRKDFFIDCYEAYKKQQQGPSKIHALSIWLAGIVVGLGIGSIINIF